MKQRNGRASIPIAPLDDKTFIKRPSLWPRYPFLPMKNRERSRLPQDKGFGLLLAFEDPLKYGDNGPIPVIVHVNLFDLPKAPNNNFGFLYANFPKTEYPSIDALLADGWVID